ncbi:flavodoxin domain-containing protein, partial [Guyparkeria sp. 1SP6A2]|nr:flavodoxin domain-containing protein [Guyparkeria sp. 1SP6A2]
MPKMTIVVGTMYGGALDVAEQVKPLFEKVGYAVVVSEQPTLTDVSGDNDLTLFCLSTTGSGDFPGNIVPFVR